MSSFIFIVTLSNDGARKFDIHFNPIRKFYEPNESGFKVAKSLCTLLKAVLLRQCTKKFSIS